MLRKMIVLAALGLFILPAMPAKAQFQAGDWELTLGGTGSNGPDFDGTSFGFQGSIGYFMSKELEISLRQSVSYTDITGGSDGSAWGASTRIAVDYHFDMGRLQPYIGASLGYAYGDGTTESCFAGPEAGIKYFVNSTTFIQFSVEYQFFFDSGSDASEAFSDGQFLYGLNIGFRWR